MIINTKENKKHLEETEHPKNTSKPKALILLAICIVSIIVIIVYQIYMNYNSNFNYLKTDRGEALVYTSYSQNKKEVPCINVDSQDIRNINNDIVDFCNNYVNSEASEIKYEYSLSGNYLSVVVKVVDELEGKPIIVFKSYVVNLNTKTALTKEEIYNLFNVTDDIIYAKIHNKYIDYYDEECKEGYLEEQQCNFDCFLEMRGGNEYLNNIQYFIRDGKLSLFKPFDVSLAFGEDEFYTEDRFEFQISD